MPKDEIFNKIISEKTEQYIKELLDNPDPMNRTKEGIIKEFDEKYHYQNGVELLLKSPNHFQVYDVTHGIKSFILEVLDEYGAGQREEERKAFGSCTNCYGKGYCTVRIGSSSRYHSEIHLEYRPCGKCGRGKEIEKLIQTARQKAFEEIEEVVNKLPDASYLKATGDDTALNGDDAFEAGFRKACKELLLALKNQNKTNT